MSESKNRYLLVVVFAVLTAGLLARWATRRVEGPEDVAGALAAASSGAAGKAPLVVPGPAGRSFFAGPGGPTRTAVPRAVKVDQAARGSIQGTVLDPEGRPLAGAQVVAKREDTDADTHATTAPPAAASAASASAASAPGASAPGASASTGPDGTYRLPGLDDGTYTVQAKAAGLRAEPLAGVVVRSGEEVRNVDFILEKGERILGIVLDPSGKPLEGASVEARALGALSLRTSKAVTAEVEASCKSAADGSFELGGLTTGRKSVLATGKGYRRSEPVLVDVKPGGAPRVELRLDTGVFIAGKVTRADGSLASGVRVEVRAEQGGGPPMMGGGARPDETFSGASGEDGRYRVDGLAGRRFRVVAWPEESGLAPAVRGGVNANDENADLVLETGASVFGTVVQGGGAKTPVAGASVVIGDALTKKAATSDAQGRFEIGPIPPGKHDVRASAEGKAEAQVSVTVKSAERKEITIELAPGCTIEGKVFAIVGGSALPGATVRAIEMREQDRQGGQGGGAQGGGGNQRGGGRRGGGGGGGGFGGMGGRTATEEMGVEMVASGADLAEFLPEAEVDKALSRNATTDAGGRFRITDLPFGEYRVYAAHPEYPGSGAATKLDKPGETAKVEIGLAEGGAIAGRVVDSENAARVDEQVLAFSFTGRPRMAKTDEKGLYKMRGVAAGSYFVMLSPNMRARPGTGRANLNQVMAGMNFESKNANVEAGRTTEVNFGNEAKAQVHGQIVRSGDPVQGAMLTFLPDGGMAGFKAASTDPEGRYETELIPGKYVVRIENLSETLEVPIAVPRLERNFQLSVGSISGRVMNAATGEPLRGARVNIYKAERKAEVESMAGALGAMAGETRVRDDGTFSVGGIAPGLYTVTGQSDGFARARQDGVDVPPDAERSGIELACEPGGVLKGRVIAETGDPVPGAAVVAVDASATDLPGGDPPRTDELGLFEVKRFSPGRYRVSVITETFAPWRSFVEIKETAEIAPVLATGGLLEVTVIGEDGRPVPGATVDFRYPEGDRVITGFMDFMQSSSVVPPDGRVRKPRLPAGPVRVVARVEIPGMPALSGSADAAVIEKAEVRVTVVVRGPS